MSDEPVNVSTDPDGSLVIQPREPLGPDDAVELRRTLVHAVRRIRPPQLVLDLRSVPHVDSITVGILAAACHLGEDHRVAVFVDHSSATVARQLNAVGVAAHRLRHVEHASRRPV